LIFREPAGLNRINEFVLGLVGFPDEGIFGRGGPWFAGDSLGPVLLLDEGVNPAGVVYEALTCDVSGAGIPDSDLYKPGFNATRQSLDADGVRVGGGQTDQTDLRSFLASSLKHFDGYLVRRGTQISHGR
jgi:hypothetical protein